MKKSMAMLAAVLALAAAPAMAQTSAYRSEVSLFGSWENLTEPQNIDSTVVQLRYGYYFTPQAVGTVGLGYNKFSVPGADSKFATVTIGAKYYFSQPRTQAVVPFLDGDLGVATTDTGNGDDSNFTWEIGGGVSFFLDERTSIDGAIRYFNTNTDSTTKGTRLFVGLTTRF